MMCGIFGFYKKGWAQQDLDTLGRLNIKRGNQAFGGLSLAKDSETIFRYSKPFVENLTIPKGDFILCHCLASTGDAKRIHPFETDRFIFAHNGILLDYKAFSKWNIGPVDSQYLLGGIQFNVDEGQSVIGALQLVNELVSGQRACWLWDRFDRVAYFWRVMSPLFYTLNPFVFSSAEFENSTMMEEGAVYQFDPVTDSLSMFTTFNFYSPYKV